MKGLKMYVKKIQAMTERGIYKGKSSILKRLH